MDPAARSLTRFAWLSIAAAVATIGLKVTAYALTGSVGLLSDALESVVNLAAAAMTLAMLALAARPPDEEHPHGHTKAEYFASGVEGALILLAAVLIGWTAVERLRGPRPIEQAGLGLAISTLAAGVNWAVARVLYRAGRRHHSIALEADAHHLMTDVWTSAAVLAGVGLVAASGWQRLDPLVALGVAVNIVWTGVQLVRRSALGLLDSALAEGERRALQAVLDRHQGPALRFHALRTRQAGARRFVTLHVLVPGDWTVRAGHERVEEIERDIRAAVPNVTVLTHLEALDDPSSFEDEELDRRPVPAAHD
ncbi:MAG TPA: cation diffusion facilitator family transporter [Anaeromyxobacter sp.]|nr:cation diffusion facilitator family transporter [Anaeromyxobacter sp.]